jgi:hypothetical protein
LRRLTLNEPAGGAQTSSFAQLPALQRFRRPTRVTLFSEAEWPSSMPAFVFAAGGPSDSPAVSPAPRPDGPASSLDSPGGCCFTLIGQLEASATSATVLADSPDLGDRGDIDASAFEEFFLSARASLGQIFFIYSDSTMPLTCCCLQAGTYSPVVVVAVNWDRTCGHVPAQMGRRPSNTLRPLLRHCTYIYFRFAHLRLSM